MKKKLIPYLLITTLTAASASPALANAGDFSSGEPECLMAENLFTDSSPSEASTGYDYDDDDDFDSEEPETEKKPTAIRLLQGPAKTSYWYGVEASRLFSFSADGIVAEITYDDGTTQEVTAATNRWYRFSDEYGNYYSFNPVGDVEDTYPLPVGNYKMRLEADNTNVSSSETIDITVVPLDQMKTMELSTTGVSRDVQPGDPYGNAYFKVVPPKTGNYKFTKDFGYSGEFIGVRNTEFDYLDSKDNDTAIYALEAGETYYIGVFFDKYDEPESGKENVYLNCEYQSVDSLKILSYPEEKIVYNNDLNDYTLPEYEVEINYSDGRREVVIPTGKSQTDSEGNEILVRFLDEDWEEYEFAAPGTYELIFRIANAQVNAGNVEVKEKPEGIPLKASDVTLNGTRFIYEGKPVKPTVSVKGLEEGKDYELLYISNTGIGKASVIVRGMGEYTGDILKNFDIILKTPRLKNTKSVAKKGVTISWDKVPGATGYRIYVKNTKGRWTYLGHTSKTSVTHSYKNKRYPAKSGKTYTYTVKAYHTSDAGTVYSGYSKKGITGKAK